MTETTFASALRGLTEFQRQAVEWDRGSLLVLAGPGSGKTQVLTCRIARILDGSRDKNFRVLALTFTNKAADEMKKRVAEFVPGLEERATIATFHSFCGQILRQHGVHMGINPNFVIYSSDDDRKAVLEEGLQNSKKAGNPVSQDFLRYLPLIDRLKARLVSPADAEKALLNFGDKAVAALTYGIYEAELHRLNALDFNSLILETHRLLTEYPAIASRYRRTYPYWLVDEFQDTNTAQYQLMRVLGGNEFRNIFVVADDDQIIYQWNGASYRQIQLFLKDFGAETLQLPTNFRCPPAIVEAANRLVAYNAERTTSKKPLLSGKKDLRFPAEQHLQIRRFSTEEEEAYGIASDIAALGETQWGQVSVLGRNRALLIRIREALQVVGVPSIIAQRRDEFLSPEFRWIVAVMVQSVRPMDRRNLATLVGAFNRFSNGAVSVDRVVAEAEVTGRSFLATWHSIVQEETLDARSAKLVKAFSQAAVEAGAVHAAVDSAVALFATSSETAESDIGEDASAWRELSRDIAGQIGKNATLDQFLQELHLRSKEPSPAPNAVTLMTVHAAKGLGFDIVYVVGLAEDIMPSFQSRQKGDKSPEMEEERRNCFVAITRTKERLVLSFAAHYRGWPKRPSRFLTEMELLSGT